jgi:hypothetical protein
MGFTLTMGPLGAMLSEPDASDLKKLLQANGAAFDDQVRPDDFEEEDFFSVDEQDGQFFVTHWEVGWSWWSHVQELMAKTLGPEMCPTAQHLHAWYGVSAPARIPNIYLRDAKPRAKPEHRSWFTNLFNRGKNQDVQQMINQMVDQFGGPTDALVVGSSLYLLEEMQAAIERLQLDPVQMAELYDADPQDPEEVGKCYLLMAHHFVQQAVRSNHLVWWIK